MPNVHARRAAIAVVAALLSGLALVASAAPASAAPVFEITVTTPEPLIAGASGFFDVNIFNGGADPSVNTLLEVTVPAGLTVVGPDSCVTPNQCLVGAFGTIGVGNTSTARIHVQIDPDFVLDNGAGTPVASAPVQVSIEHDTGAQTATRGVPVGERSDLRITKYINPPVADAGGIVTYSIDVDNLGPSTARAVTIAETILGTDTGGFTIQSCAYSVSQGGGSISQFTCTTGPVVAGQFGLNGGTFGTDFLQPIGLYGDPGDPPTVGGRLRASFRLTAAEALTLEGQARVLSATSDPDLTNNLTDVAHSFVAVADLSVTATPDLTAPVPGDVVAYTVEVTNSGPSTAQNVVVEQHVPAGMEVLSATATVGSCTTGTPGDTEDPVECLLGTMGPLGSPPVPVTETITVAALVTADPGTALASQAFVRSDTPDRDNTDDGVQADITVAEPDLLFNPLTPARQFDTRNGSGGVPVGRITAGVPLAFTVSGLHGVPAGAEAVALNVTVTGPLGAGWLRVFPCDDPAGTSSNLNFTAGQTIANAVIAPVDGAGQVCFLSSADTHVISDVSGWFRPAEGLTTMTPVREFDTRNGTGGVPVGPLTPGSILEFDVTGVNGVPAGGVAAVVLNVTAAQSATGGHVTVFPCLDTPVASNLNHLAGASVPNLVIAPVGPDGTVCFTSSGTTHLVADVSGWIDTGADLQTLNPSRVLDTRNGLGGVPATRILAGAELEVDVTGRLGVPDAGVGAVVLNVTAVGSLTAGHLTVYPCGDRPLASNLNFVAGRTVANAVVAPVSPEGTVCISSVAATDLVVDISGWFTGSP